MVGFAEQESRSNVAWYEREVGTVVAIEYLLGTCSPYYGYKRVVVIGMAAEERATATLLMISGK